MENDIFSNIELPKENLEEELLETDDFKIKLKILTNYKNLSYFLENGKKTIILEEKTYLQVNFKLPKTINEIINFADRISKFLSLSTLEFEQITELQLITEDENRALINKANVKIFDKEKDYNESELRGLVWCELSTPRIGKDIKENQKFGKRTLAYTFYFSHNKNFFKEGLKNWLENYDNNIILINVFFSVYFHATLFIENKIKDYVAIIERYGKKVLKVEPVFENYISNENFKSISEKIDTIINKEVSNKELLISLKKNIEKSNKKKTKTNDFELTCRKIFEDESLKKLLKTFNLEIDEKLFTDISSYRNTATHLKEDFESLSKENKEFSYTCLLEYIIFTQFFLFTDPEKKCINKILYSYDKNRVNLRIHYLLYLMKINTLEENKK